jgi:hypothetical protein
VETAAGEGANTEAGEEGRRIKVANLLTDPQQAEVGEGGETAQQTSEERKNPLPPLERLGKPSSTPAPGCGEPCWPVETCSPATLIPVKVLGFPCFYNYYNRIYAVIAIF